jgi:hypothetical protein
MSYDPEIYLESTIREIKAYVEANINTRIYKVVMEFPGSIVDSERMPLSKTLIHFELDADDPSILGMGDNVFETNYNSLDSSLGLQRAEQHMLNFDVGIWSSDRSGGTTSRSRAKQILQTLFGVDGIEKLRTFSDGGDGGIEIRSFTGGRFVLDVSDNDSRLYRMVDCQLNVRVFSRTPIAQAEPGVAIEEILQAPDLTILG